MSYSPMCMMSSAPLVCTNLEERKNGRDLKEFLDLKVCKKKKKKQGGERKSHLLHPKSGARLQASEYSQTRVI